MSRLVISADSHLSEPLSLWEERLPEAMKSAAPHQEVEGERLVIYVGGEPVKSLKIANLDGMMGRHTGDDDADRPRPQGGSDPDARLKDLEIDGVSAEVIYPTIGLFIFLVPDPELQLAFSRVYNDWCAETFFHRADVFAPAALIPAADVPGAVTELERVAELGFKAAMLPMTAPAHALYNDPVYDPLWKVASDAAIPMSFHVGTGTKTTAERGPGGAVINYVKVGLIAQDAIAYFAAGGVLARHPGLHVVMVESGGGYLAYVCERMDEAHEEHEAWVTPKLDEPPSAYVSRQVHVTLGADRAPLLGREITGVASLMWASDYPHPEGTWPDSQRIIATNFADLPADAVDAIVGTNAADLYRIGPKVPA